MPDDDEIIIYDESYELKMEIKNNTNIKDIISLFR
jgi:hypothetical protein